ncbi:MAG: MBL fold metallo-hydrolase [Patescibacteria group bacterium]
MTEFKEDDFKFLKMAVGTLIMIDVLVWILILFPADLAAEGSGLYFLDVGQGDSSLAIFPRSAGLGQDSGVKALIDGGPANGLLQKNLESILSVSDRYIDLIIISHPQIDHFGGLIEAVKNYKIGAVITNGEKSESVAWLEFVRILDENKIPIIGLSAGDKIKYRDFLFDILWPEKIGIGGANEQCLAMILSGNGIRSFFGGDLDAAAEKEIAGKYDIDVDILKVSHHGSKFSSDPEFLKEISPLISIIEVGKNSYGHPTIQALERLKSAGSRIFRTDLNGLVNIKIEKGVLKILTDK